MGRYAFPTDNLRKVHVNPEGEAGESFDMPEGLVADTPIQDLNELIFEHADDRRRAMMKHAIQRVVVCATCGSFCTGASEERFHLSGKKFKTVDEAVQAERSMTYSCSLPVKCVNATRRWPSVLLVGGVTKETQRRRILWGKEMSF